MIKFAFKAAMYLSAALAVAGLFGAAAYAAQSTTASEVAGSVFDEKIFVPSGHWSSAAIRHLNGLGYCGLWLDDMVEKKDNYRRAFKTGTAALAIQAYGTMREKLNEEEPVPFEAWVMLGALGAEYQSEIRALGHNPNDMAILAYAQMPEKAEGTHIYSDVSNLHWLMIILDMVFEDFGTKMRHAGYGTRTLTRCETAMVVHRIFFVGLLDSKRKMRMDSGQLYVLDILLRELKPELNELEEYQKESNVPDIRSYLRSRPEFPKLT